MPTPAHTYLPSTKVVTPLVANDFEVCAERQARSAAKILAYDLQPSAAAASSGQICHISNKFMRSRKMSVNVQCQGHDGCAPDPDNSTELWVPCENCEGLGEFVDQHITGYDPRDGSPLGWEDQYPCPVCGGSGRVVTEAEPITLDDFAECFGWH